MKPNSYAWLTPPPGSAIPPGQSPWAPGARQKLTAVSTNASWPCSRFSSHKSLSRRNSVETDKESCQVALSSTIAPLYIHRLQLEAALFQLAQDLVLGEADIGFDPHVRDEFGSS